MGDAGKYEVMHGKNGEVTLKITLNLCSNHNTFLKMYGGVKVERQVFLILDVHVSVLSSIIVNDDQKDATT